jgi:GT2 family glycosyltransferase
MGQTQGKPAPAGPAVASRILMGTPLPDGYGACPTCSQLARRTTYKTLGGFDPDFRRSEDTEFNIRLAMAGGHFVGIKAPMVIQKMTPTPEKSLADENRYMGRILDKHRSIMDVSGQFQFCRSWLTAKQAFLEGNHAQCGMRLLAVGVRHPIFTIQRLLFSFPNIGLNFLFRRFHRKKV